MEKEVKGKYLFISYLVVLVWILLFKMAASPADFKALVLSGHRVINLIPFGESVIINGNLDFSEIINNSLIFIPFGGLLGIISKQTNYLQKIMMILGFSVCIEVSQYILGIGATDITDVLTNTLGGIVGLVIYIGLSKLVKQDKLDKFLVNVGSVLFAIPLILLSLLLIFNS
ncbi:VanZ family protein [Vagococcus fessus]|uniref:VanZ family protein n=1 Tax=Vagococcus fessus TaxID=120370 RepID=A0A430A7B5_9ENTE|nr:VanZ family protein [Vagococcus fessus]RSU02998.1 VanZ family protein [Vagococcus fessus]